VARLKSFVDLIALNKTFASTSIHAYYTLTGLTVDSTRNHNRDVLEFMGIIAPQYPKKNPG